ncbi:MAG: leucyl aminopeptidase [Chloroflexi bacterium]|nr:leucyl aminopeptidase [Chloroflexota bacterium]
MEIQVKSGEILSEPSDLAVLASFEDAPLPEAAAALFEPKDFSGKHGQTLLLYTRGSAAPLRLMLLGLGKAEKASGETIRQASAIAINEAQKLQVKSVTVAVNGDLPLDPEEVSQAFAEGIEMGSYRYWGYRTGLSDEQTFRVERATVLARNNKEKAQAGITAGQKIASGVNFARDLVNGPGYAMHPPQLGEEALKLGKRTGIKVTVLDIKQLTEQGFGGILAVGKGSDHEPRFIIMEYGQAGAGTPTICLVGKGLTFDSGGLSLKPAEAMKTMKSDMAGAAAVYGAMQNAAELKLPLHVVGLVSAAENMPSSSAYRPGDIVKTLSGKTIEVLNTDAEGRIILSDALFYAQRYNPAAVVEFSTLTGAIIIALGSHASGMMGTDQALLDKLIRAGEVTGERVWQLPLWDEYHEMIKSEIADIKNIAGSPAGSITAGAFLAEFVGKCPFAHIDIAGTAWVEKPTKPYDTNGATGVGVRLATEFLRSYA